MPSNDDHMYGTINIEPHETVARGLNPCWRTVRSPSHKLHILLVDKPNIQTNTSQIKEQRSNKRES